MNLSPLAENLIRLGCPSLGAQEMAIQLERRARQLAVRDPQRSESECLQHLLGLMRQGWAAQSASPPASSSSPDFVPVPVKSPPS